MPYHDKILSFLRWHKGESVSFWLPMRAISQEETGHVPRMNPVPKKVRRALEKVIAKDMAKLIKQNKVIRVCNTNSRRKAGVRINESLVKLVLTSTV